MQRSWIFAGAILGLSGVALAAVAAHVLPRRLDPGALDLIRTAIEMQMWHALALLGCAAWYPRGGRLADLAGASFLAGTILFCGALYSLGLAGQSLGGVAPGGGLLLMLGWLLLALSALRRVDSR